MFKAFLVILLANVAIGRYPRINPYWRRPPRLPVVSHTSNSVIASSAIANMSTFDTTIYSKVSPLFHGRNIFISTLTINTALAYLQNGAQGQTLVALSQGLRLGNARKMTIANRFHTLLQPMENNHQMVFSNGLFLDNTYPIAQNYKMTSSKFFANVTNLNLNDTENASNLMNNWIYHRTHGHIQSIISPHSVRGGNGMIVLSSYYFHGIWQTAFDSQLTKKQKFLHGTCVHGQAQNIEMMYTQGKFNYGNISDLRSEVVEMPYANSAIKLLVILPWDCDGLSNVEQLASEFNWTNLGSFMNDGWLPIDVTLPKFNIEFNTTLEVPLTNMGMENIFSENAQFGGISKEEESKMPLRVTRFVHRTLMQVDENNVRSGYCRSDYTDESVESLTGPALYENLTFMVDHPFLFMVRKYSNTIAMGRFLGKHG